MEADAPDNPANIPAEHPHGLRITGVPTENPTRWWLYLLEIAGTTKQKEIADRAEIDQSHLSRWKDGYPPSVPFVVKVAEAYGRNVLEAFVAAGILTDEQAQLREVRVTDPDQLTDEEVLEQVRKRFSRGS